MTDSDTLEGTKDRLFTELITCLLRGERASILWTYWLLCKALKGQTQSWVLFYSWLLMIWVWSLPKVRLRTAWAVSCDPGEQLQLALESAVPGKPGVSVCINEPKAEPRRSQPRSSVHLYQYWMLNIKKLKTLLKKYVIYKILCQAAEQTEKLSISTKPKQCLWLKTKSIAKSNWGVGSLSIETVLNPKKHFVLHIRQHTSSIITILNKYPP